MRTARRTLLASGAILMGVAGAAAQAPVPRPALLVTERPAAVPGRSPIAVLERLVSFDANKDKRISRDELPERMQDLVARGDKDADAALDPEEIKALVDAAGAEPVRFVFNAQSSEGLAGVISDLKLPPAKHERALVILSLHKPPADALHKVTPDRIPVQKALDEEMRALLDDEEYENFVAAATRLSRTTALRVRTIDGPVGGVVGGVFSGRR